MDISSASPDVQTGKQTKHWLHIVLHAVPYGQFGLWIWIPAVYGYGQYLSLTGQYGQYGNHGCMSYYVSFKQIISLSGTIRST